jgi:RNA polymerase sigma-70 factor, ECF subfamily
MRLPIIASLNRGETAMDDKINHLWQEFHDRLLGFIRQRVNNPSDAEDLLQEVFLRIYQRLSTVRDNDRLVSWMFQIARNAIIDYYRSAPRRREISSDDEADLNLDELFLEDDSITFNQELAACLQPMIEDLPEAYRKALHLVEIQGVSQQMASETLGISLSGTKSRVQRGRQKLKDLLLQCCQVQLDPMGNVLDYKLKKTKCSSGAKTKKSWCC